MDQIKREENLYFILIIFHNKILLIVSVSRQSILIFNYGKENIKLLLARFSFNISSQIKIII